jgi:tripartite-type tricarboxylate transporter receptor subunit TctC
MRRREILAGLAACGTIPLGSKARAASFPSKDITIIIPYAAGGGFDSYIRAMLPSLQARLPDPVKAVPENVDGAGGAKAMNELWRARPDGSTIGVLNVPGILILREQGGLGLDPAKLTWLCNMGTDPYGLVVPASSPVKSIADLQALSKQRPVKFTTVGPASTSYSATRIAANLLGLNVQLIAGYRGTNDYVVAAVRGDGDAAIASLTALAQFRASNLVRVLATFEEHSSVPGAQDATTLKLPDLVNITQLRPLAGPPRIPADIAAELSKLLMTALRDPKVQAWAAANSANLTPDGPEETVSLLQKQTQFVGQWKKYLAAS